MRLFYKDADFAAFERVVAEGVERGPVDLLTYCLMGNHWHLVVHSRTDRSLTLFMGWVGVTHIRRHDEYYRTRGGGHLYQGRSSSFPIQEDAHAARTCGCNGPPSVLACYSRSETPANQRDNIETGDVPFSSSFPLLL